MTRTLHHLVVTTVAATLVVLAAVTAIVPLPLAAAQPSPPAPGGFDTDLDDRRDRARELAREASALFAEGNRRAAVAKFEEAYALYPTPVLLYNIGKAYVGLSDHVRAHRALSRFLRETEGSDIDRDRRAEAQSLLADAAGHVGVLSIAAPRFPGASVEIDGVEVGTAPLPTALAVPPGVHEVVARRDGLMVARVRVSVLVGGSPEIELDKVHDDTETVIVTREVPSRPVYKRWWFWTAIGAAAASTAAIYIATNPRQTNEVGRPPLGSLGLDDFTMP